MTPLHRLASIVRWIAHRRRAEADLDDELRTFVEMAAADQVREGASPAEARRLAALHLGGVEQVKERVRTGRHGAWLDAVWRDLHSGLRQVRRTPAFSAIAIATLALGIGVNTAMFSAVDAVLIRPLPYADADHLVMVWDAASQTNGGSKFDSTPPEWQAWRRHNTVFTDIAASQPGDVSLSGDLEPEMLPARKVSGNFWSVLGVSPLLGRVFTDDDDERGARVVVISHGLWQRRFGASPDVIGRTITLDDTAYDVVGVMPRDFYFMPARDIDVWLPTSFSAVLLRQWNRHEVQCVARLKSGVSLAQAREAMAALTLRLTAEHVRPARSAAVTPLRGELAGKTSLSLLVLSGAAAVVLLIACVNLANLLMARGTVRQCEVVVRAALGASRGRLLTQFLIESLVLAGLGAVAGLALALPVMRFLETLVPPTMAAVKLTLDWRVLAVSAALAMAAAVTFGLAPALRASRLGLEEGLRDGGRGTAGASRHRVQHVLIVAETALAVVLLTTGGLLLQTLHHFKRLDLGIRSDKVLTFVTPLFRYRDWHARVAGVEAQLEKIRAVPGVISAGAISRVPLTVTDQATFYRFDGQSTNDSLDFEQVALSRVVTRDYFATVGARLREGRFFDRSDRRSDAPVVVVNESFVDRHFSGRTPLGARLQFGNLGPKGYWYTIVGVVKEIRERGVAERLRPAIYRVHEQGDQSVDQPSGIVVHTALDPSSVLPAIREAIWSLDKNQPIARVQTIDDIVARQLSAPAQNTALLGAFALLALLLASIGLYGVLSYAVTRRTHEIGVRMALGATSRDIALSFGGRGLILTIVGLAIGVIVSIVVARTVRTLFYGVQPDFTTAMAVAAAALLSVAACASIVPARRAARIEPKIALEQE